MKQSITLIIAFFVLFSFQAAHAQTYKHALANQSNQTVELVISGSPISVEGYNGNQIVVKNTDYHAPPKRAKGLHKVYGNGPDNSGIGISVHQSDHTLKLVQTEIGEGNFMIKVPDKVHLKIQKQSWRGGDITVRNQKGELTINAQTADINLKNITGPVVAHSTTGDITAAFSHLSDATPTSISLVSGDIDLTLPASTKANIKLQSISGDVYTDFDMKIEGGNGMLNRLGVGHNIDAKINDGGTELNLKTTAGDIYLRKKK